ncbi:MAG: protoheme IX farnesyltransferase [Candidatus Tectimicrobiota bacterium]
MIFFELGKGRIALLAALSTATGYLLAAERLSLGILAPTVGLFLLACGASAINQYQEREIDALMQRTRGRPLPTGRVTPHQALTVALGSMLAGSLILWLGSGVPALALGLFAAFWYNGVYVHLKRVSPFAAVPGAVIGAIPPAVGWVAAGGWLFDPKILALCFFFFIWQVPHFWLLLLSYGKDYERAGLPSLTGLFSASQLAQITFVWILATAVTCLLIPLFGTVRTTLINLSLLGATVWLVWNATRFIQARGERLSFRCAFREINLYALVVISLLSLDKLVIVLF